MATNKQQRTPIPEERQRQQQPQNQHLLGPAVTTNPWGAGERYTRTPAGWSGLPEMNVVDPFTGKPGLPDPTPPPPSITD
jgi:hypothetical protein